MARAETVVCCGVRLASAAVWDVIEPLNGSLDAAIDGKSARVTATLSVFGNESGFSFELAPLGFGRTRICIEMERPSPLLSGAGRQRAVNFLADSVAQHLENEGATKGGKSNEAM